jgi:hypothetical protein
MQFQTPQFVDVEDKIIGPLSFRQFLYLAGGAGLAYTVYRILPLYIALLIILPILALSLALAFVKINERPFITVLEAAFHYYTRSKLYIWSHAWKTHNAKKRENERSITTEEPMRVPSLSQSKLKDIAWSLDVQKNISKPSL